MVLKMNYSYVNERLQCIEEITLYLLCTSHPSLYRKQQACFPSYSNLSNKTSATLQHPTPPLFLVIIVLHYLVFERERVHSSMLSSSSASFLRQLSAKKEGWKERYYNSGSGGWGMSFGGCEASVKLMEGFNMQGNVGRKRVMVVVDDTSHSKHAMLWALTHVANKGDSLTLLHVVPPHRGPESSCSTYLVNYLGSLCKDCKPGVSWLCLQQG